MNCIALNINLINFDPFIFFCLSCNHIQHSAVNNIHISNCVSIQFLGFGWRCRLWLWFYIRFWFYIRSWFWLWFWIIRMTIRTAPSP
ncbi:hypothetical protein DW841_30935 [Hungatella hathewayi]|nr:hypothetical protein DXC88_31080 [Hungatella hathewayi]RHC43141.1 hypothetical protein DW841_30935 [Hungatella hathewayi]